MEEQIEIVIQKEHENHYIGLMYTGKKATPELQFCGELTEVIKNLKKWEDYIINYLD